MKKTEILRKVVATLIRLGVREVEIAEAAGCDCRIISELRRSSECAIDENVAKGITTLLRSSCKAAAANAIAQLRSLGVLQKTMAFDVGYKESTISRAFNDPDWAVSPRLALRLGDRVQRELARLAEHLPMPAVTVMDTCPAPGAVFDEQVGVQLKRAFQAASRAALTGAPTAVEIPENVLGALAALDRRDSYELYGMLLRFAVDPRAPEQVRRETEAQQVEILIHELTDLIGRLQSRVDSLRQISSYRPHAAF